MNHSFRERLSKMPSTFGHALMDLVREMAPVVLFFFIVFGLIGLLYKLFVSQYAIEFSAFTKAAIAALIMGKVVYCSTGPEPDIASSGTFPAPS